MSGTNSNPIDDVIYSSALFSSVYFNLSPFPRLLCYTVAVFLFCVTVLTVIASLFGHSDLDRDFWNNNDSSNVQQRWSSYPPKEFLLNMSPYAPYGDPRLTPKWVSVTAGKGPLYLGRAVTNGGLHDQAAETSLICCHAKMHYFAFNSTLPKQEYTHKHTLEEKKQIALVLAVWVS